MSKLVSELGKAARKMNTSLVSQDTKSNVPNTVDFSYLPEDMVIGKDMKNIMAELEEHGHSILEVLDKISFEERVQDLFKQYIAEYSDQSCRIAVVGQMKAGKSAFVNAFIGRSTLLPSDVNPWTAVVTRLHFGSAVDENESIKFSFFEENEWQKIAEGGGRLRELVQRFLPGFETKRLIHQLQEMRTRAQQRLGEEFYNILGQGHQYDIVTPEIIRRYVCAGEYWDLNGNNSEVGRYSDVTEAADIYLKPFPFCYPSTIIDTPGTNDPFFVRDEITCQNLNDADIFIVVLHAQQALSITDLGLLRILQGLHKQRIIIFINRIDQLNNWQEDSADIKAHVEYILKKEFPNINFPVIVGSALWGQQALSNALNEPAEGSNATGMDANSDNNLEIIDYLTNEQIRSGLFMSSGLPEVAKTISQLMLRANAKASIGKIISNLNLALNAANTVLKNNIKTTETAIQRLQDPDTYLNVEAQALNNKINYALEVIAKSASWYAQYEQYLSDLIIRILDIFRTKLNEVIITYAESEIENLKTSVKQGKKFKVWNLDTVQIRQKLEEEFYSICKESATQINSVQEAAIIDLKKLLKEAFPSMDNSFLNLENIFEREPYLSAVALNHKVSLDLDRSWWKHWWSRQDDSDKWSKELFHLIQQEFFPMVERLAESANSELKESMGDALRNFSTLKYTVTKMLQQYIQDLQDQSKQMVNSGNSARYSDAQNSLLARYQDQVTYYKNQIGYVETIAHKIKLLQGRYTSLTAD